MRFVIVSNRLPFTVTIENGQPQFQRSPGGVATGLWSYLERRTATATKEWDFVWLGWPGAAIAPEHQAKVRQRGQAEFRAVPVFFSESSMGRFYEGFCNKTIWPLFHYFPSLVRHDEDDWLAYQQVNRAFCDAVAALLRPDDIVWVHDYQLMLLPRLLREQHPEMAIGFFLHIPFPSFELFRQLPGAWRREILEGLLGASVVGFHTHDYTRHFLSCVLRTLGHEHHLGRIALRDRSVKVDTFPMGIDFERFSQAARSPETEAEVGALRAKFGAQKVVFSVDRLDYTKGIMNRLRGYRLFLEHNPQWHGKIVFVLAVAPSRTGVESYQSMKQEIDRLVGQIMGTAGQLAWTPLIYQYHTLDFPSLLAMYRLCDVALITPLRDGMNLVAKEFIASRPDQTGVLILSEMTGAAKELGEALLVNPFYYPEIAQALEQALAIPPDEQIRRNRIMQERLRRYDVTRWAEEFFQALIAAQTSQAAAQTRFLTGQAYAGLAAHYRASSRRAILLDYDGTLVPFVNDPQLAQPDEELLNLLAALCADEANRLLLVSGRPRRDLDAWFSGLPLAMIAEHGVWLKAANEQWRQLRTLSTEWKEQVRPILQTYLDRLPGAALEEKDFSLAWHYRRADPEQGSLRAQELLDDLADYTRNIDIQVLEGHKLLEVRNTGVTKGTGAVEWLARYPADFILAIGDDGTDEDLFRALPPSAWSVRVGWANTAARFQLTNPASVRGMLGQLAVSGRLKAA